MTRKHYKAFAELFKRAKETEMSINGVITEAAKIFAADNARFDRDAFFTASGLWIKGVGEYARNDDGK